MANVPPPTAKYVTARMPLSSDVMATAVRSTTASGPSPKRNLILNNKRSIKTRRRSNCSIPNAPLAARLDGTAPRELPRERELEGEEQTQPAAQLNVHALNPERVDERRAEHGARNVNVRARVGDAECPPRQAVAAEEVVVHRFAVVLRGRSPALLHCEEQSNEQHGEQEAAANGHVNTVELDRRPGALHWCCTAGFSV